MYLLFVLITPAALWQFRRGNVRGVLAASSLVWLASGLLIRLPEHERSFDFGAFNPLAYQFLFLSGLALGTGAIGTERVPQRGWTWLVRAAVVVTVVCFVLRVDYALEGAMLPPLDRVGSAVSAEQLGPLRLLDFYA